jgi:fumarate hydratase, class I
MEYTELLPLGPDDTPYRLLTTEGVSTLETSAGTFLRVEPEAITLLTATAMHDIAHYLRPAHLAQLRRVLDDPEASDNDRFVALDLLKNASIAAGGVLPMCQDTGTAIVKAKKGQFVFTGGGDEAAIARGVQQTYRTDNLRYSQLAALSMYEEVNTGSNLPAEIKVSAVDGDTYSFLFIAKGGGSANKSYLFQETKALLNEATLLPWLFDKLQTLGTAACPPYHLAVVIGGTSAEFAVETAKLASTHYLDTLPSWRPRCWPSPSARASVPSSAVSTSATTCGSSACPATAPAVRSHWRCRARPTARRRARSPATACSSRSWRPTPPASCLTSPANSTTTTRPSSAST